MRAPRLSTRVAWSVSPVARWRKVARFLPGLALVVLELVSGGSDTLTGCEPIDPRIPADSKDHLEQLLGTVKVIGRGAGLPDAYPSPQVAWVFSDRTVIRPGLHDVTLPLAELTVTEAHRVAIPWTKRKAADAIWRMRAVGPDADVEFRGHWVLLAQLGTLGGWPEPDLKPQAR